MELFYFVPFIVATLVALGSIKSFDLHFPVCAFSRVYWLFTYLRRTVYSCTRSIFLCVCVVSVHTMAHMCRSEDNMWELWVLGEKTMWTWGLNSIHQACWHTPLPMEWSHQALVPLFESDNLLWFLSLESSLCILGISLSSYAPQVCPIPWVTSNSVASFLYSWPPDPKKLVSLWMGLLTSSSYTALGTNYQLDLAMASLCGKHSS